MQAILDHLLAVIIATGILLVLAVTQMRASHTGIEQVTAHSAKVKAITFGEWIEDDILSAGVNFGRNRYRFEAPTNAGDNTESFRFYSDSLLVGGDTLRHVTRYELVPTDTVELSDGIVRPLYELRRFLATTPVTNGTAAPVDDDDWEQDGQSMGTLSLFHLAMLSRTGVETVDVDEAEYIRIRFAVIPEMILEPENYIRELYWSTTLKVRPFWEPPDNNT